MAKKSKRARIQLKKHVLINGKHTEKGTKLELDRVQASDLVSAGQAEFIDEGEGDEDGRDLEEREQYGVRVETPTHGDPGPRVIDQEPSRPEPSHLKAGKGPKAKAS